MRDSPVRWLRSRFFFPLAAISVFAVGMRAGWAALGEPWLGPRLLLNLALAWVPYLLSLSLVALSQRRETRPLAWWSALALWAIFFPNAPYLITDWLYLPSFADELWYSIGLFMAFSLSGLLLSIISLYLVHGALRIRWGRVEAGLAIGVMFILSGVGIFLGRFLRLNSWDLFTNPKKVVDELAMRASRPEAHVNPLAFSLGFALLLAVCYGVFAAIRNAPRSREEEIAGNR
jgi:uncharacterized membrane protein